MKRVTEPLSQFGANFATTAAGTLPLCVMGTGSPFPIEYKLPVASAQVKSAILLAGLNIKGTTTIIEPKPTRDHSEIMLRGFGAEVISDGERISIKGYPKLKAQKIIVPADPSSAAFLVVAALITEGSELLIKNVGMNPHRVGLFQTLVEMGGQIEMQNQREECGEKVADLLVKHSKLNGVTVPAERAPSMIDEYPVLAVAAAFAEGTTKMLGLEELRVKESDRLQTVYDALVANGVKAKISGNDLLVQGAEVVYGGGLVKTQLDHRIAMAFLVLGLAAENPVKIDDGEAINTSFPEFVKLMQKIGAKID
jgi:3-phosphoshikimate 1-carboxyvinyltransferase